MAFIFLTMGGFIEMKIYSVYDPEFAAYGRVVDGFDIQPMLDVLANRECPEGVVYEPSDAELEALPVAKDIQNVLYGTLPIQIGYTNGHCRKMNALEYHRDSEFNAADTDIILLLALRADLSPEFTMDTSKVKAFKLPKGVLVEVFATSLHYAPCQDNDDGYRCIVVLPRGTNMPISRDKLIGSEDKLMTATNKWLIGHPDGGLDEGTFIGFTGPNPEV